VLVQATAYCPCEKCCGIYARDPVTSIGRELATHPYGIAADHTLIPPYTVLTVPGYGTATVDDTGSAMRKSGEDKIVHIDLRYETHQEALDWGRRWVWIAVPSELPAATLSHPMA
jgi:3D (Asp-Asp-Asp) domain-containing protein